MNKRQAKRASKRIVRELVVDGAVFAGDTRTIAERKATLENSLRLLKNKPDYITNEGLIKYLEEELKKL